MIIQKWKQCGVAVQGRDHIEAGVVCQDNVAEARANGVYAIALSDGGGSRKFSQIGSEHATRAAVGLLTERFEELYERLVQAGSDAPGAAEKLHSLRLTILDHVLSALRAQVSAERTMLDFGCTLQFAAVKDGRYFIGHVGDGVMAALYQRGLSRRVQVLSHPENGDGPNVTFFITDHNAAEHLRLACGECRQLEGILMMSDGPEEVLYDAASGMHPNTQKLFDNFAGVPVEQYRANLERFLERTVARHSYDDLSLNLLYLETLERESVSPAYESELFGDVTGKGQIRRISAYGYFLDPTAPAGESIDPSFFGGEPK